MTLKNSLRKTRQKHRKRRRRTHKKRGGVTYYNPMYKPKKKKTHTAKKANRGKGANRTHIFGVPIPQNYRNSPHLWPPGPPPPGGPFDRRRGGLNRHVNTGIGSTPPREHWLWDWVRGGWHGGGRKTRRRTRKKRGGDDWVTIDDLGRDFNGDDFEVGQIIDIKQTATSDPIPNLIIIGIYDKKIVARQPGFEVYYSDIYSVKFPRKKPPKSAMKTGRKTGRKKTEKRRLDPKLPLGHAILGGRRKKRKTRRKPRRRRKTRRKKRRKSRKQRGGNYAGFGMGDQVVLSDAGLTRIASGHFPAWSSYGVYGGLGITPAHRNNAPNWQGVVTMAVPGGGNLRGTVRVRWNISAGMGGPPRLWSVPYKDYTAAPIVFGPDRGGPVGDIRLLNPPERLREVGINSNQPGGHRRKTRRKRRKSRKQRGGVLLGNRVFNVGDMVRLSPDGRKRIEAMLKYLAARGFYNPGAPHEWPYRDARRQPYLHNAANWLGKVTSVEIAMNDPTKHGGVRVLWDWEQPAHKIYYESRPPVGWSTPPHWGVHLLPPIGDLEIVSPSRWSSERGQPGGKRRRSRKKRRKKRRRKTRRKKQRGGNPQKDMHDAIKEDHELGVKQAIHNGAKVNQPRNYTKPKPLEKDTPEGRVCTGEVVMRKGKHTPLIRAVQENSMMGIVEDILGDRVGQEPGIDLKFKDPYYEPPKTAQEIAEEMGNKGALKRIKERANSDAGLGSGGIQQGEDDKKENIYEFD